MWAPYVNVAALFLLHVVLLQHLTGEMYRSLPAGAAAAAALLIGALIPALLLQGCTNELVQHSSGAAHRRAPRTSLLQVSNTVTEEDGDNSDDAGADSSASTSRDDSSGDVAGAQSDEDGNVDLDAGRSDKEDAGRARPALAEFSEAPDEPSEPSEQRAWRHSNPKSLLQMEDMKQQHELQGDYDSMARMDDPDEIDKAMKKAWARMANEDQQLTRTMQHVGPPRRHHPRLALMQGMETKVRRPADEVDFSSPSLWPGARQVPVWTAPQQHSALRRAPVPVLPAPAAEVVPAQYGDAENAD